VACLHSLISGKSTGGRAGRDPDAPARPIKLHFFLLRGESPSPTSSSVESEEGGGAEVVRAVARGGRGVAAAPGGRLAD
jgi:hypothetical protein